MIDRFFSSSFMIRFRLSSVIAVLLSWSYLVNSTYMPFTADPFVYALLLSAFIVFASTFYTNDVFEFNVSSADVVVYLLYLAMMLALAHSEFSHSIGGDELYHAKRASSYWFFKGLTGRVACAHPLPVSLINSYCSLLVILSAVLVTSLNRSLRAAFPGVMSTVVLFAELAVLGILCSFLRGPMEPHPPLRLLPLFLGQLFFGLQDFSFRLPGVFATAFVAFLVYKLVRHEFADRVFYSWIAGALVMLIPTVYHCSTIIEPSIWVFVCASIAILSFIWAQKTDQPKFITLACVILGLGVLFRQNLILFWPAAALFLLANRTLINRPVYLLLPILFSVPYFFTIAHIGHPVVRVDLLNNKVPAEAAGVAPSLPLSKANTEIPIPIPHSKTQRMLTPFMNVYHSLVTGEGPRYLFHSSDFFWILFLLAGMAFTLIVAPSSAQIFYLALPIGYFLFQMLIPDLWGVGRYQAEYIGPCTMLVILLLFIEFSPTGPLVGTAFVLGAHSLFLNNTLTQDIYFDGKFHRRLSTEFTFPYRQALDFVHAQAAGPQILMVGGAPDHGEFLLWLRGFTPDEAERYARLREKWDQFLLAAPEPTPTSFADFLKENQVSYVLVEFSDLRERKNRPAVIQRVIESINTVPSLQLMHTVVGDSRSAIDIYAVSRPRY